MVMEALRSSEPSPHPHPTPESVRRFPSWFRRGLKVVRPSGGGRSCQLAPIAACAGPLPPPKPWRASLPPKIGRDFFGLSLAPRVSKDRGKGSLSLESDRRTSPLSKGVAFGTLALLAYLLPPSDLFTQPRSLSRASLSKPGTKAVEQAGKRVNVNRATSEELQTLPGIGPAIAQRILDYRRKNPPFRKIEELLIIRGISPDRLQRMKSRISLE